MWGFQFPPYWEKIKDIGWNLGPTTVLLYRFCCKDILLLYSFYSLVHVNQSFYSLCCETYKIMLTKDCGDLTVAPRCSLSLFATTAGCSRSGSSGLAWVQSTAIGTGSSSLSLILPATQPMFPTSCTLAACSDSGKVKMQNIYTVKHKHCCFTAFSLGTRFCWGSSEIKLLIH